MKARTLFCVSVFALIAALTIVAQPAPTILAALEYQKPKNGTVKQYEDGRKQKATWHKQQNDPQPAKVSDPKARALFETTSEVLIAVRKAFEDYERRNEPACRQRS